MKAKKERKAVRHPHTWLTLLVILTLSFVTILLSSQTEVGLTGGGAVQTVALAREGTSLTFEVKNIPGVYLATFKFCSDVKGGIFTFDETKPVPFTDREYSHFTVTSPDAAKVCKVDFTLKVLETVLNQKGIAVNDLRLYANGQELPLTLSKKEYYLYYTASATELGQFVIGKATATSTPTTSISTLKEEPAPVETPEIGPVEITMTEQPEPQIQQPAIVPQKVSWWQKVLNFFR